MRKILVKGLTEMGLSPAPETLDRLEDYARLLLEKNQVMNLTAITEPDQVARLHFLDSAAVMAYGWGRGAASPPHPAPSGPPSPQGDGFKVVDIGTGAGFPGMVLKILDPSLSLTLVDSLGKRVDWLGEVCEALSLDGVECLHARAEELSHQPGYRDAFDAATSRAVAAYPALCELCLPFVRVGGVFIAMKSVESGGEVKAGESAVKRLGGKSLEAIDYPVPGTDVVHRLVRVEKLSPTPGDLPRAWGKIKKRTL